jgi:iron complex transport system ATP-binding protein
VTVGAAAAPRTERAAAGSVVRMEGVSLRRGGVTILEAVNWTVERGEDWALVGPNGSGKTTLLGILNGYVFPSEGRVQVLGERLGGSDVAALRRRIGLVSALVAEQVLSLGGERALDVVVSGRHASIGLYRPTTDADRDQALGLLQAFDAQPLAARTFQTLSQGEKQRVLLARAWMAEPELLVLDEPASGLDIAAREELVAAIEALRGRSPRPTLVHVTHHVEEIGAFVGHALLLRAGRVVRSGPKARVLTDACLSETFGLPLSVAWHGGRAWVTPQPPPGSSGRSP